MRLPQLDASRTSVRPVYLQIADHLRAEISSDALTLGTRLPAIRTLARDLGVNRDTVAMAYEALATDGLLESTVGRGTFVAGSAGARSEQDHVAAVLSPEVERLLRFENARPRFAQDSGARPMHSLIPDPDHYPVDDFRRCLDQALREGGPELFLYGSPQGHAGLRERIAERSRESGVECEQDELVLCHGASQGISLAIRLFAGAGDTVAVELPTYHNVLATLLSLGLQATPVEMESDGPNLESLDRILARPDVKAFYTIPTFHNPLGTTSSLANRRGLLEVAARHGKPVIEDAFEIDLRFRGRHVPPLAALDPHGLVVHLTSFSKSLFPGARIGAMLARARIVEGLVSLKHATDLSDSLPMQAAMDAFVAEGSYDRHLEGLRLLLRARVDCLTESLAELMPRGTQFTRPDGGYQVWVELPFDLDSRDLLADAARAGVLFAPGAQFMTDGRASRCLRLTIAQVPEEEIRPGVRALAQVVEANRRGGGLSRERVGVHL